MAGYSVGYGISGSGGGSSGPFTGSDITDGTLTGADISATSDIVADSLILDDDNVEALLVRADADGGDKFTVDTTNNDVQVGGVSEATQLLVGSTSDLSSGAGLTILRDSASTITDALILLQSQTSNSADGDTFVRYGTQSANWAAGVDQGDSDKFKINASTTLDVGSQLEMSSTETVLNTTLTMGTDQFINPSYEAGITASVTQTQGQQPLTAEINEISTVATANDTVTLPTASAARRVVVINNGASTLQIFPDTSDNFDGLGENVATTLAPGAKREFLTWNAATWVEGVATGAGSISAVSTSPYLQIDGADFASVSTAGAGKIILSDNDSDHSMNLDNVLITTGYSGSRTGSSGNVFVGTSQSTTGTSNANCVLVGSGANCNSLNINNITAVGQGARVSVAGGIAIGAGVSTINTNGICIGRGARTRGSYQAIIGSENSEGYIEEVHFGRGVLSATPSATVKLIVTRGNGTDITGSAMRLQTSGTGNATGHDIQFYTGEPVGSGGTVQTETQRGYFTHNGFCVGAGTVQTNMVNGDALISNAMVLAEVSAPTADTSYGKVWTQDDNLLYFQDGGGTTRVIGGTPTFKSYSFSSFTGSSGVLYSAGFYDAATADANLTQASTTQTYGTALESRAAHAFIVAGAAGTASGGSGAVTITVTGISIDDSGTRNGSDSETIVADITAMSTDEYIESTKKWLGQVTFTLDVGATGHTAYAADFNYGLSKYEDMGNRDFKVTDFEVVGVGGAAEANFDIELCTHTSSGWTYAATGFVPGNGQPVCQLTTDHSTDDQLASGTAFAYKRAGLGTTLTGSGSEGVLIRITTTSNSAVEYMDAHIGMEMV